MSSYKLTYFNFTGLGEPLRFLLSYGGIDFKDNRLSEDDWSKLKSSTPLEQLPILEIDGKLMYQSNAIARFLARQFNLLGSNEFEAFEVDAAIETITDLREGLFRWAYYFTPAAKAAAEEETFKKTDFYLDKLEAMAKKNGGYLAVGKLSAADIVFAGFIDLISHVRGKDITANYPSLKSVVEKVVAEPGIKSYIAKRPKTEL